MKYSTLREGLWAFLNVMLTWFVQGMIVNLIKQTGESLVAISKKIIFNKQIWKCFGSLAGIIIYVFFTQTPPTERELDIIEL